MKDVEGFTQSDDVPEADAVEQQQPADFDDDTDAEIPYLNTEGFADREANEADLIEQAFVVPTSDDERDPGY